MNWTPEKLAELRRLLLRGLSDRSAGQVLGVTRNAVAGVVDRHGLVRLRTGLRRPTPRKPAIKLEPLTPGNICAEPGCAFSKQPGRDYCAEHLLVRIPVRRRDMIAAEVMT